MALSRTNRGAANQAYSTTSSNTLTSGSFTPAGGAVLLALFTEATTDDTPALTVSSTHSGQGSWTVYTAIGDDGFGSKIVSYIGWSVCGPSPGAGTITATRRAGSFSMGMNCDYVEVAGADGSTPVRQNKTNTSGAVTTIDLNLTSSPLASSFLFFSTLMNGTTGVVTVPTGTTQIGTQFAIGSFCSTSAEDLSSVAQNNQFTGGNGGNTNSGVAIEIQASTGAPVVKFFGGTPFAGLSQQKGRW